MKRPNRRTRRVALQPPTRPPREVSVEGERIDLGSFLKFAKACGSGGEAKHLVQSGLVAVNGEVETKRGRALKDGDVVATRGLHFRVAATPPPASAPPA